MQALPIYLHVYNHVQVTVQRIVKDSEKDETMVQRLLDFKAIANNAISTAFVDEKINDVDSGRGGPSTSVPTKLPNNEFVYALSDAFTVGFKARRNKPAEMIAKYLDKAMRRGQGATSDAQFEALLDSVLALYRFTDDKDVFRTFYHRGLAKRLLLEKSASDDFEAGMLKKLKESMCPPQACCDAQTQLKFCRIRSRIWNGRRHVQGFGSLPRGDA
jgi:cullin-4